MTMGSQTDFPTTEDHQQQMSTFSALNLLKNYNHLLGPTGNNLVQVYHHYACGPSVADFPAENLSQAPRFPFSPIMGAFHPYTNYTLPLSTSSSSSLSPSSPPSLTDPKTRQPLSLPALYVRRPRGEKKPIPDDQKDDRYYERRKRNNQAAKKSRDARKFREDQIALKATLLEHENALLKAQVLTLREETHSLRQYILKERTPSAATTTTTMASLPGKFIYGKSPAEE